MTASLFYQGLAIGLLAAIPLGPMGMLCVQRTLEQGRKAGLVSAAGLTVAAAFWCVVAAQGLSVVARYITGHETAATVLLGAFLIGAGAMGLVKGQRQARSSKGSAYGTLASYFLTSMIGVILNPITFVTMTAVLAILGGVKKDPGLQGLSWLAVAVFIGGMMLWLAITHGVTVLRDRMGEAGGLRINQALNWCIFSLGVIYLVRPLIPRLMG